MEEWFPRPKKPDATYARSGEGSVSWLRRSTLALADDCRRSLNANLSAFPNAAGRAYSGISAMSNTTETASSSWWWLAPYKN
jgi:hypothetical protein